MKKISKLIGNSNGQSLVEFALVLPVLLLLILGMIEFGWILNRQIILTSIAREGARSAVVCNNEQDAYKAVTDAIAKSSLTGATVDQSKFTESWKKGNAEVILSIKIKPIVGIFPKKIVPDPFPLSSKAEMRVEK